MVPLVEEEDKDRTMVKYTSVKDIPMAANAQATS
jgi:hypothetical protein